MAGKPKGITRTKRKTPNVPSTVLPSRRRRVVSEQLSIFLKRAHTFEHFCHEHGWLQTFMAIHRPRPYWARKPMGWIWALQGVLGTFASQGFRLDNTRFAFLQPLKICAREAILFAPPTAINFPAVHHLDSREIYFGGWMKKIIQFFNNLCHEPVKCGTYLT